MPLLNININFGKLNIIEMAKFRDLHKCDCRVLVQAPTTINARLQATMPGKQEECCAMLSVSIGALCFTFL